MLDLSNISVQFGGKYLYRDVNLRINAGDRIALVGANGSGKSTLLKLINGDLEPESGEIHKQKNISVGYLPQENITHTGRTLLEEALSALSDIQRLHDKEEVLNEKLSDDTILEEERDDLIYRLGEVHHRLEELGSYSARANVEKILVGLGFTESDFDRQVEEFSGGWQMRIALAKILISQNDILLLDEPTNHLDIESLRWLIDFLLAYKGALILISHDKYFINRLTGKTVEIYFGKVHIYNGTFSEYLEYKEKREEMAEHQHKMQMKKIKETQRFIERFRYKNTKAKQVQSRIKQLEKMDVQELPDQQKEIRLRFPEPPKSGRTVMELKNIRKAYGSNVVFDGIDFKVERGEKIAFVGPNGAGKTTLARIISGEIPFDGGSREPGHNVSIAYYAQDVAENLNPDHDILDSLAEIGSDSTASQLRSIAGSFLFTGDDVFKKIRVLSGGEKSRVVLARLLLTKANLLVLDEPTNHLDFDSKKIVQQALNEFTGSIILVSHDIDFMKPLVNKVVEIRRNSFHNYPGGIDYFLFKKEEQNEAEKGTDKRSNGSKDQPLSKKEEKRLEAEKRQKKFNATKDIIKEIENLESEIEELEKQEKELETELSSDGIYNDPAKAKEKNIEYSGVRTELKEKVERWENLNLELEEIEEQFS